jgi:hypothetical protein
MTNKIIVVTSIAILSAMLSGCGYDGHYRYPCQNPANWGTTECIPPVCESTGTCTKDLLGYDPLATESAIIEVEETAELEEINCGE